MDYLILLEGQGGNCGFSEQKRNFLIMLREILIRIKKPLPRAGLCVELR